MQLYDKNARLRISEDLRRQIGEVDAEIERLTVCKEEVQSAYDALTTLEAVLRRMGMLAREAARPEGRRPGVLVEFERCRIVAEELRSRAKIGGKNVLDDLNLDDLPDFPQRKPG